MVGGKPVTGRTLVDPPKPALMLPAAPRGLGQGETTADLGDSPWAGATVSMVLSAKDEGGNTGRSAPVSVVLPARSFTEPLARALVEQRRDLVLDPDHHDRIDTALDALTLAPDLFNAPPAIYLGLRTAKTRLDQRQGRSGSRRGGGSALGDGAADRGRRPQPDRTRPARHPAAAQGRPGPQCAARRDQEADGRLAPAARQVPRRNGPESRPVGAERSAVRSSDQDRHAPAAAGHVGPAGEERQIRRHGRGAARARSVAEHPRKPEDGEAPVRPAEPGVATEAEIHGRARPHDARPAGPARPDVPARPPGPEIRPQSGRGRRRCRSVPGRRPAERPTARR